MIWYKTIPKHLVRLSHQLDNFMTKLILASKSPRRKQILKENGFKFKVIPANIDEEKYISLPPLTMIKTLSRLKSEKIFKQYKNSIILGADTTVVLGKEMLGKPTNLMEAKEMLKKLSGSTHTVYTGFTIINPINNTKTTSYASTKVTFKKLSERDIYEYINNNNVLDLAGSYAIQEGAGEFVNKIEGDYLNVIGLPTKAITKLKKMV